MNRRLSWPLLFAVLGAACTSLQERPRTSVEAERLERQILLTIHQSPSAALGLAGETSRRYLRRRGYGPTPAVERTISQLAREHGLTRVEGWPITSLGVYCEVLEVPAELSVDEVLESLARDPRVDLAQRMNEFTTLSGRYDDPYAPLQPSVTLLDLERAHEVATGRGVTVAVIDSAVDARHPELRDRVRIVRDLVDERPGRRAAEIHGTAVAGIIASGANNAEGIVGVAPEVTIAALRACRAVAEHSPSARCSSFSLARALESVITLGAQIVNLSFAGPADPLLGRMLDEVLARGTIVVVADPQAATGLEFPASHPRVLVAAAFGGPLPDAAHVLGAPAHEVITTLPNGAYAFLSGTSLAAAHVSGVAALLLETDPTLGPEAVANLLAESGDKTFPGFASISASRALERLVSVRAAAAMRRGSPFTF